MTPPDTTPDDQTLAEDERGANVKGGGQIDLQVDLTRPLRSRP